MENKPISPAGRQINQLLLVLTSAIACALLLSLAMLYHYGPSGNYIAKNVLLAPELLSSLSYEDHNPNSGKQALYTFDRIAYTYWDKESKKWKQINIDRQLYEKFYQMIAGEKSILDVPTNLVDLFLNTKSSSLIIFVDADRKSAMRNDEKPFQSVEFLQNGDYFRIELREEKINGWAYFHYPAVEKEILELFLKSNL